MPFGPITPNRHKDAAATLHHGAPKATPSSLKASSILLPYELWSLYPSRFKPHRQENTVSQNRPAVSANAAHTVGEAALMQSKGPPSPPGRGNLNLSGLLGGPPWGSGILSHSHTSDMRLAFFLSFSPTGSYSFAILCEGRKEKQRKQEKGR